MNIFLLDYYARLNAWHSLRKELEFQSLHTQVKLIDNFWQQCPMVNHYLHPADVKLWPNPWELLNDNIYCYYARALGIIYTFLLLGNRKIDLVNAVDYNSNDVVLVIVNDQYVLNYWPNTVDTNKLSDFTVKKHISIDEIKNKIK